MAYPIRRELEEGGLVGHYRILGKLRSGGMGAIFKAEDLKLGRRVALKFLHPQFLADPDQKARLVSEARAAAVLDHPNICTVYEIQETPEGELFIAMALYEGESLRDRLARGPLPLAACIDIGIQVANGLAHAHDHGVLHRDVNPANLIITREGVVKIVDFGLAKVQGGVQVTQPDTLMGTPGYMSPEQIAGNAPVDPQTDVWSLGVVLYEMAAGQLPFPGQSFPEVAYAIVHRQAQPIQKVRPDLPQPYCATVERALRKNKRDRYPSAGALAEDLAWLRDSLGGKTSGAALHDAKTQVLERARPQWLAWRPWAVAALVLLLAGWLAARAWKAFPGVQDTFWAAVCGGAPAWAPGCELPSPKAFTVLGIQAADPAAQVWADGLAESIHRRVHQIGQLDGDFCLHRPRLEREQHGVKGLIEGRLEHAGGGLRLTVVLRRAQSRQLLRRFSLTKQRAGFSLGADDLSEALAASLGIALRPEDRGPLGAGISHLPEAVENYLLGLGKLRSHILDNTRRSREELRKELESAIASFEAALHEDPDFALAHAMLGEAWRRIHELSGEPGGDRRYLRLAIEAGEAALKINPQLAEAHETLALAYWSARDYARSVAAFRRVLAVEPANLDALDGLSKSYAAVNQSLEARAALEEAARQRPNCWNVHAKLGSFFLQTGLNREAEKAFLRSVAVDPSNPRAYNNLSALYVPNRCYEKAEKVLLEQIRSSPTAYAHTNLGTVYYYMGPARFRDAVEHMKRARDLNPDDYVAWFNLGEISFLVEEEKNAAAGAMRRARDLAEQWLARNPTDQQTLRVLANCYSHLGDSRKAFEVLERLTELAPHSRDTHFELAKIHARAGDLDATLRSLERAMKLGQSLHEIRRAEPLARLREDPRYAALEAAHLAAHPEDAGTGCQLD